MNLNPAVENSRSSLFPRPSHAYHTVFLRTLRVALDVEVRSGKEHAAGHGLDNLWRLWDRLAPKQRAWLICGDANYGNERILNECEARGQNYLFRQRGTKGVGQLILRLEQQGGWQPVREDWQGCEGPLQLTGWTRRRRAVVFRRKLAAPARPEELPLLEHGGVTVASSPLYEYLVFLSGLTNAAEQLQPGEGWRRIWRRILEPYLQPAAALLGGSG